MKQGEEMQKGYEHAAPVSKAMIEINAGTRRAK